MQLIRSADTLRLTALYALSAIPSVSPVNTKVYVSVSNETFCIHHRSPATLLRISFCNPMIVTMFMLRLWITCEPVSHDVLFFLPQSKRNSEQHLKFIKADLIRTCLLTSSTQLYFYLLKTYRYKILIFDALYISVTPVPLAERSKAWVCGRSPPEIVGSNPTGGMDVCCVVCCQVEVSA